MECPQNVPFVFPGIEQKATKLTKGERMATTDQLEEAKCLIKLGLLPATASVKRHRPQLLFDPFLTMIKVLAGDRIRPQGESSDGQPDS
jgi:hypothetical protein